MAYSDYNFTPQDTLSSIANMFGITVSELAKVNNIQSPFTDSLYDKGLGTTIKVPEKYNGNESFENKDRSNNVLVDVEQLTRSTGRRSLNINNSRVGFASEHACSFRINYSTKSDIYYFPCYPENFSDSRSVSYSQQNPLGRSEPFQIYQNSGPRVVSVSFRMHREMLGDNVLTDKQNYIDRLVAAVQSATYPEDYQRHIPPRVTLTIGKACSITGVIASDVSTTWSDTIIDGRYQIVELSFSVTEATGNPITLTNNETRIFGY
jgi:LysM repeat protein